ncbi:MAG: hypothetical protein R3A52_13865 [Polyangiales bacterium]
MALHAVNAVLVFALLRRALDRDATLAAWAGAALWALHPLRVEVVASAVGLAESLCAAFALCALIALTSSRRGALTVASFACALASARRSTRPRSRSSPPRSPRGAPPEGVRRAHRGGDRVVVRARRRARAWLPRAGVTAYDNPLVVAAPARARPARGAAPRARADRVARDALGRLELRRARAPARGDRPAIARRGRARRGGGRAPSTVARRCRDGPQRFYLVAWLPASNTVFLAPALYAERWTYLPSRSSSRWRSRRGSPR